MAEADFFEREMSGSLIDLKELNSDWTFINIPNLRIGDELLAYSINAVIHDFDPYNEGIISQTKFYKLLYLLSDNLKRNGLEIKLPFYWYRYGPVVPYFILPEEVFTLIPKSWGKAVIMGSKRSFEVSQGLREIIDDAVNSLKIQYGQSKTKKIVMDVYKLAPYEFQRKYKDFIKHLEIKISLRNTLPSYPLKEHEDIRRLEEMIDSFEEMDFPQIYDELLQWRLLLKNSLIKLNEVDDTYLEYLSNSYWDKLFCKHLQVKTQENMPSGLIKKWERDLPISSEDYKKEFKKIEYYFYSNIYKPNKGLNKNIRAEYNECIRSLL